jgi:HSP20 family protein
MAEAKKKTAKKATRKPAKKAVKKTGAKAETKAIEPFPVFESEMMRPLMGLRDQIEDMFDRYFHGFPSHMPRLGHLWDMEPGFGLKGFERSPRVDMSETDKGYEITAELPGLGEDDLDISVTDDVLTISGEKKEEQEQKEKDYYVKERRYGRFSRSLRMPQDADADKISASFETGVLKVEIPKTGEPAKKGRKISLKKS